MGKIAAVAPRTPLAAVGQPQARFRTKLIAVCGFGAAVGRLRGVMTASVLRHAFIESGRRSRHGDAGFLIPDVSGAADGDFNHFRDGLI